MSIGCRSPCANATGVGAGPSAVQSARKNKPAPAQHVRRARADATMPLERHGGEFLQEASVTSSRPRPPSRPCEVPVYFFSRTLIVMPGAAAPGLAFIK